MSDYKKILVAVDLSDESAMVAQRARSVASGVDADLHVIHVIEPLSFAYGGDIPMDFSGIQDEIHQQAAQQLKSRTQALYSPDLSAAEALDSRYRRLVSAAFKN